MRLFKVLGFCAAFLAAGAINAYTLGSTSTYAGLTWSVSTNVSGLTTCDRLFVDATGDVARSDDFVVYGTLDCPALGGSYASSGNAYFTPGNLFNMTLSLGVVHKMVCTNLSGSTLTGTCPVYDNFGNTAGSAFVRFL